MNKHSREALKAYYAEADSWANDQRAALQSSRRTAWVVAGAAVAVAVLEAFALMLLTPLKTVEPYTLLVDRTTGYVQALAPLNPALVSSDRALTQSFLVQYVIARESFDADTVQSAYQRVGLWSAGAARTGYIAGMQASNPDSPLVRYPRTTVIDTRVKSVSALSDRVALVRFETRRRDANGTPQPPNAWIATIRYQYSNAPLRLEDRMINPLGFQVLRYRRDAEALPVEPPAEVVPATPVRVVPAGPATTVIVPSRAPARAPVEL